MELWLQCIDNDALLAFLDQRLSDRVFTNRLCRVIAKHSRHDILEFFLQSSPARAQMVKEHADLLSFHWCPRAEGAVQWVTLLCPLVNGNHQLVFKAIASKIVPFTDRLCIWNMQFGIFVSPEQEDRIWQLYLPAWIFSCQDMEQMEFILSQWHLLEKITKPIWFEWLRQAHITDNLLWLLNLWPLYEKHVGESQDDKGQQELEEWWTDENSEFRHHVSINETLFQCEAYEVLAWYIGEPILLSMKRLLLADDGERLADFYERAKHNEIVMNIMYEQWMFRYECVRICNEMGYLNKEDHVRRLMMVLRERVTEHQEYMVNGEKPFVVYPVFYLHEHMSWNPCVLVYALRKEAATVVPQWVRNRIMIAALSFFAQYERIVPKDLEFEQSLLEQVLDTDDFKFIDPDFYFMEDKICLRMFLFWMISVHHLSLFQKWVIEKFTDHIPIEWVQDMFLYAMHFHVIDIAACLAFNFLANTEDEEFLRDMQREVVCPDTLAVASMFTHWKRGESSSSSSTAST